MTFTASVLNNAAKAAKDTTPHFKVGDRVVACNDCYCCEKGIVVNHETNMLGILLTIVKLDMGTETCFYTYELVRDYD
jgi:hypothetical protein